MMQELGFAQNGLGGISVHPEYARSYKDWINETRERRKEEITTRTFSQYMDDPNGDGDSSDAFIYQDWWSQKARPGKDPEYSTMATELALMENGLPGYWTAKITQPQFIRTTAEDYFPDWMNVFTKANGERIRSYDMVKGDDYDDVLWRGLSGGLLSLGNIAVGGIVAYAGLYVIFKLTEKNLDEVMEFPFIAVSGAIKGVGNLLGTVAKQFTSRGDAVAAFNDMPA